MPKPNEFLRVDVTGSNWTGVIERDSYVPGSEACYSVSV